MSKKNMGKLNINELTVASIKDLCNNGYIANDLVLIDNFSKLPFPNEPRRTNCLLLALCTDGQLEFTIDTVKHTVNANNIIIVSEGQVVNNYQLSNDCKGIALVLSYDFFNEIVAGIHELSSLFLFSRSHPVCQLTPLETRDLISYIKAIKLKVNDYDHHFRKDTVRLLISTMIYDLSNTIYKIQQTNDKRQTRAEKIFTDFIRLVEQDFREERRVSWYAEQLCITPKYLSESVKTVSRRTPNEWIDNYVCLEIRVQLRNSTKTIKEIAEDLHFPNQSFFGKYFKEHVGVSPSEYRREK